MRTREAAKGLIRVDGGRDLLFVAGSRELWNLPGGGIKPGETTKRALYREIQEETSASLWQLAEIQPVFDMEGETTCADGTSYQTTWKVFSGRLTVPLSNLVIPPNSEITDMRAMSPEVFMSIPEEQMSELARRTVIRWANSSIAGVL